MITPRTCTEGADFKKKSVMTSVDLWVPCVNTNHSQVERGFV